MSTSKRQRSFYEELVHNHSAELYSYAHRYCGDPELAEDLVAETFTAAWRGLKSLRHKEKARAWLYGIMRHQCSRWLRDKMKRSETPIIDETHPAEPDSSLDTLETIALQDHLQTLLDRIDPRYREPFLLVFLSGYTCQETATQLDLPLGTVLSRIHRARKALRREVTNLSAVDKKPKRNNGNPPRLRTIGGQQ